MTPDRTPMSAALRRAVLVEAGHQCAIPICRQTPVDVAHIVPYAEVGTHEFENLIALCPNHHDRYDRRTGQIDRSAMKQYKANLSIVNGRYSMIEQRVLEHFAATPAFNWIDLPWGFEIAMHQALKEGLFVRTRSPDNHMDFGDNSAIIRYVITDEGRALVRRWANADPIEDRGTSDD